MWVEKEQSIDHMIPSIIKYNDFIYIARHKSSTTDVKLCKNRLVQRKWVGGFLDMLPSTMQA